MEIQQGMKIKDNVVVLLTDSISGKKRKFSSHNTPLNYAMGAFAQWIGGKNNSGYQPLSPPSQIELGSGTGTPSVGDIGLFTPIPTSLTPISYSQPNTPSNGTITFAFQIAAGTVTQQITEALMMDAKGNAWFHTMFGTSFTPSSTENISLEWEVTFSV